MNSLPYEIVKNIIVSLDRHDRLNCLTLCKSWHRAIIDVLYIDVSFKKISHFRSFLHSITHHFKNLSPGLNVKSIKLGIDYRSGENTEQNRMCFTEFELLARHCPNTTELQFDLPMYWNYMLELNFDRLWLKLRKMPDTNGGIVTRAVLLSMGKRLEHYALDTVGSTNQISRQKVYDDLSLCGDLKTVLIRARSLSLTISDVTKMISTNKNLKDLSLYTRIERDTLGSSEQDSMIVQPSTIKHLKSFACIVHCQNHPILEYIRTNIKELDKVVFDIQGFRRRDENSVDLAIDEISRAIILDEILELFYSPTEHETKRNDFLLQAKHLRIRVGETTPAFLDNLLTSLVCMTSHLYNTYSTSASIAIDYIQDFPSDIQSFSDTHFLPSHIVHHKFSIISPYAPDEEHTTAFADLQRATLPIVGFINKVSIGLIRTESIIRPASFHCIDSVLDHFKSARIISFSCNKLVSNKSRLPWRTHYILECGTYRPDSPHVALQHLSVIGGELSAGSIAYLVKNCPSLTSLTIDRSLYNAQTLLIIDYICLSRNICLINQ
ncbi:hypothetical protein BY458DRAFT_504418 [Sporodiniella umbellata]|nr:hypothetical protein BY458DRAFT_504418 [Sporodiniella umbellata]